MLDETARIRTCAHVHARAFDQEIVILDLERGQYYALDEVGTRAWQRLTEGASLGEAADMLLNYYEVDRTMLVDDLVALASEWIALGLVQRSA